MLMGNDDGRRSDLSRNEVIRDTVENKLIPAQAFPFSLREKKRLRENQQLMIE